MEKDTDIDSEAGQLVDAALNGDTAALKQLVEHLGEADELEETLAASEPDADHKRFAFTVGRYADETKEHAIAAMATRPTTLAAAAEMGVLQYGNVFSNELTVDSLAEVLREQVRSVIDRNLDRGVGMLAAQAHTLDAIYNVLLKKALRQDHGPHVEMFFKIALRAQSQCRATWEAVSAIQNPPIAGYVGQANIASQQQVNNGTAPTRAPEKQNSPSKLLEQTTHEPDQWMDRGSAAAAASSDSAVEAVGTVDGTAHRPG